MFKEFDETKFNKKKEKSEYPTLKKALGSELFEIVGQAYLPIQMVEIEDHLKNHSWVANYLPGIVTEARRMLKEKEKERPPQ
jgi:hypothetical protein